MNNEKLKEFVSKRVPYLIKEWDGAKWLYVIDKTGLLHYHYGDEDAPFKRVPDGCVFFKPIEEITEDDMIPFFEKLPELEEFVLG